MKATTIIRYVSSDRNIVLFTDDSKLVGINYWQGVGDDSVAEAFLTPDHNLTDYVLPIYRGFYGQHLLSAEMNKAVEFIDELIYNYSVIPRVKVSKFLEWYWCDHGHLLDGMYHMLLKTGHYSISVQEMLDGCSSIPHDICEWFVGKQDGLWIGDVSDVKLID
jgi:hypothetical protein